LNKLTEVSIKNGYKATCDHYRKLIYPLSLILVTFLLTSLVQAKYSDGTGEPSNPYQIADANDMNEIGTHPEDWGGHFVLVNDINLAEYTGTDFNIIGTSSAFTGVFNGNGHRILNFSRDGLSGAGMFGSVSSGGIIKNLGLVNIYAHGDGSVGGLAGNLGSASSIISCYIDGGNVSGSSSDIGGLVANNSGTIENCYVTANVAGNFNNVGGLIANNSGTIRDCHVDGNIDGQLSCTGGLVANNSGTIEFCYVTGNVEADGWIVGVLVGENSGLISSCFATGDSEALSQVGGLCGSNGGTIEYSYATGWILGQQTDVGGLVGSNNSSGQIRNCYAHGDVGVGLFQVGGLVGSNSGTIDKSYSKGEIVYAQGSYGGLVGIGSGTVTNSYWDKNTSGVSVSAGGIGWTTSSMKNRYYYTNVAGWDLVGESDNGTDDIWTIHHNIDYPKHVWKSVNFVGWYEVDFADYVFFANRWGDTNCGDSNDCDGCDLDFSDTVDAKDLKIFLDHWLAGVE